MRRNLATVQEATTRHKKLSYLFPSLFLPVFCLFIFMFSVLFGEDSDDAGPMVSRSVSKKSKVAN